jgi:hypothetical protein
MIRLYQPTFSAAMVAHIEATLDDDTAKRQLWQPTHVPQSPRVPPTCV